MWAVAQEDVHLLHRVEDKLGLKTLGVYGIPVPVVGLILDGPISLLRPG
jgi:hypothetical protein